MCSQLTEGNLATLQSHFEYGTSMEDLDLAEQKKLRAVQSAAAELGFKLPSAMMEKSPFETEAWIDEQSRYVAERLARHSFWQHERNK